MNILQFDFKNFNGGFDSFKFSVWSFLVVTLDKEIYLIAALSAREHIADGFPFTFVAYLNDFGRFSVKKLLLAKAEKENGIVKIISADRLKSSSCCLLF